MNVSQEQPRLAIAYPGLLTKAESENKRPYRRTIKSLDGTVYTDKLFNKTYIGQCISNNFN